MWTAVFESNSEYLPAYPHTSLSLSHARSLSRALSLSRGGSLDVSHRRVVKEIQASVSFVSSSSNTISQEFFQL
jgi:hypothetical protein